MASVKIIFKEQSATLKLLLFRGESLVRFAHDWNNGTME